MRPRELAFRAARSEIMGSVVRFGFGHLATVLPLARVTRNRSAAIYRHPRPCYGSWHHVAVPLRGVRDVFELAHPRHTDVRQDLFALIDETSIGAAYVLVNAGSRQDVAQVHFHLSDGDPWPESDRSTAATWTSWEDAICELVGAPGIAVRLRSGFSLLRDPGDGRVRLV